MAYYRICPRCGSNLDPGEICEDCQMEQLQMEKNMRFMAPDPKTGQMTFRFEGRRDDEKKVAV